MRAVAIDGFGRPPRLIDAAEPEPGTGQVRVALEVASINPLDHRVAEGAFAARMTHEFPLILGFDAAGRVDEVGPEVTRFAVGDTICGQFWNASIGQGVFATATAIAQEPINGALSRIPPGVSMTQAAALPTAGMTALGALEEVGIGGGGTLLIVGATGGVGTLATQLAAAAGAHVIATARAPADTWIRDLGASETIDHGAHSVPEALAAAHPDGIDAVLDLVGDRDLFAAATEQVRDGGTAVSVAFGAPQRLLDSPRVAATNYALHAKPILLGRVGQILAAGDISIPIQQHITLDHAPEAFTRARSGGARGKTVIHLD